MVIMKVIGIIFLVFLFLGALLYYLIQQSKKPSGIVGVLMMRLFNKAYLPMVRWALLFYNPSESPMKIWWCFKKYDTTLDVPIIDIKES